MRQQGWRLRMSRYFSLRSIFSAWMFGWNDIDTFERCLYFWKILCLQIFLGFFKILRIISPYPTWFKINTIKHATNYKINF